MDKQLLKRPDYHYTTLSASVIVLFRGFSSAVKLNLFCICDITIDRISLLGGFLEILKMNIRSRSDFAVVAFYSKIKILISAAGQERRFI